MKPDRLAQLLRAADQGERVADIATSLGVTAAAVYSQLKKHRQGRKRSPRVEGFNETRFKIMGLLERGHEPARVAKVVGVSRAYTLRVAKEIGAPRRAYRMGSNGQV